MSIKVFLPLTVIRNSLNLKKKQKSRSITEKILGDRFKGKLYTMQILFNYLTWRKFDFSFVKHIKYKK